MKGFVFAGERSGDAQAAHIIKALQEKVPELKLFGVGGPELIKKGLDSIIPFSHFEVMGVIDVLFALPRILVAFYKLRKKILIENPDFVFCVDSPAFCLKLEKSLRQKGYKGKIIHHVCPSIWIWKKYRKAIIEKNVDLLTCLLPFEEKLFSKGTLTAKFVGHPLAEEQATFQPNPAFNSTFHIPSEKSIFAIFPGSRKKEIHRNLPILLQAFTTFQKAHPHFVGCISLCRPAMQKWVEKSISLTGLELGQDIHILPNDYNHDLMHHATLATATSGTVTLEIGLFGTPCLVCYKIARFDYFILRYIVKLKLQFISLVNILLKEELFPEHYYYKLDAKQIALSLESLFQKKEYVEKRLQDLQGIIHNKEGFARTASKAIMDKLKPHR